MVNKKFTVGEMERLRESPYVLDVSASIVHFSAGFKKLFYEALRGLESPRVRSSLHWA